MALTGLGLAGQGRYKVELFMLEVGSRLKIVAKVRYVGEPCNLGRFGFVKAGDVLDLDLKEAEYIKGNPRFVDATLMPKDWVENPPKVQPESSQMNKRGSATKAK